MNHPILQLWFSNIYFWRSTLSWRVGMECSDRRAVILANTLNILKKGSTIEESIFSTELLNAQRSIMGQIKKYMSLEMLDWPLMDRIVNLLMKHGLCWTRQAGSSIWRYFWSTEATFNWWSSVLLKLQKLPGFHQPLFSCQRKFQQLWCAAHRGTGLQLENSNIFI